MNDARTSRYATRQMSLDGVLVIVEVPGVEYVVLAYDPADVRSKPHVIQSAVELVAHWIREAETTISAEVVRTALRKLDAPQRLGDTELAHLLFGDLGKTKVRGNALRKLLLNAIKQFAASSKHQREAQRQCQILQRLYIEHQPRLKIASALGLSLRYYNRELKLALLRVAEILQGHSYSLSERELASG